ncbi:peptidoglycan-binding protein [Streptomyces shenzhenensis]|uniref:peptidoglycan-binding domain-containing protein n=1 Tax=Streptomyces shenzhenensis TaxID=943815 RepID=UPI003807E29F
MPREPDNTASCPCAQRASDALRDTRTAAAAAAEDFDPLRIRPYVDLDSTMAEATGNASGSSTPASAEGTGAGEAPGGDETMVLRVVDAAAPGSDATMELRRIEGGGADAAVPTPLSTTASVPSTADLNLFDAERAAPDEAGITVGNTAPRPRRRRTVLLSVAGAAIATVAAAGFASGLFTYDTPSRDGAAPEDIRASVPERTTEAATAETATAPAAAPPAATTPAASTSPSPTTSPTPSTSQSSATAPTATPSRSPEASATATAAETAENTPPAPAPGPVLRRGDRGPEVTELQLRLKQLNLYWGSADGRFGKHLEDAVRSYQWMRGIRADESGVYDAATRASLESETSQP